MLGLLVKFDSKKKSIGAMWDPRKKHTIKLAD